MSTTAIPEKHAAALTAIGSFGYLATRELALLLHATITPKAALKAAQLTTKQLERAGLVLARDVPVHGETKCYVLTRAGARLLNDLYVTLAFHDGYDLTVHNMLARRPVIELAYEYAKAKSLAAVGPRALQNDFGGLGNFRELDALLVDPDAAAPAFGIMLVRHYDKATIERVKKACKLPVPTLLAAPSHREKHLQALIKVRAQTAPAHEEHLRFNKPDGLVC
jgi:hypothetical protein